MALRSLDNALPITPERPKKQAKTIIPAQKDKQLPDLGVNDENKAPVPQPSADASIDYISSENLKAFQDPEAKIEVLFWVSWKLEFCFIQCENPFFSFVVFIWVLEILEEPYWRVRVKRLVEGMRLAEWC